MSIHVLIAEDNQALRDSLSALLPAGQIHPTLCPTGEEFRQAASTASFDLLIIDVTLPDVSGWELLKEVRADDPVIPIVMVSGVPAPHEFPAPCVFATKPIDPKELIQLIQELVAAANED